MNRESEKIPRILLSVYACSPEWGSEVGMGWNWIVSLSKYCQLTVITETGFKESIEKHASEVFSEDKKPDFHYIDIDKRGREAFWQQGNWSFYSYYRQWQKKVFLYVQEMLNQGEKFDVIHQLNLVGYREPGYLWKLSHPNYMWGPICGMGGVPDCFLRELDFKNRTKYRLKNVINFFQQFCMLRIWKAVRKAKEIFVVTPTEQNILRQWYCHDSRIIAEVAAKLPDASLKIRSNESTPVHFVWNGVMEGRKALNLILRALAKVKKAGIPYQLDIIGDGPCMMQWKRLSQKLGLDGTINWHGRIPHDQALQLMKQGDIFLFSSWKEATSTVVNEALSCGMGVICHDTCGMAVAINQQCGIKIPLISPQKSIDGFYKAICKVHQDRSLIENFSRGAFKRAEELSWDSKAKELTGIYRKCIH